MRIRCAAAGVTTGDNFNEYLFGGDGSDEIQGQDGRDWIEGNAGNDYALSGGAGHDMVWGGEGDDTLYVDAGLDNFDGLSGGRGFDTDVFARGAKLNNNGADHNNTPRPKGLHRRFRDIRPIGIASECG